MQMLTVPLVKIELYLSLKDLLVIQESFRFWPDLGILPMKCDDFYYIGRQIRNVAKSETSKGFLIT